MISPPLGDVLLGRGLRGEHRRHGHSHRLRAQRDHEGDPRGEVPLPGKKLFCRRQLIRISVLGQWEYETSFQTIHVLFDKSV